METTTLPFKHSINRVPRQLALLIPLTIASLALLPQARAVCQEGCLTNNDTVLGDDALVNNTGTDNTAIGFNALFSNTAGSWNTATGDFVLYSNTTGLHNTATGSGALEATERAAATRPTDLKRSAAQPAAATLASGIKHSPSIPAARTTSH